MIRIILSCFLSFFVLSTLAQEITGMFNFGGGYQEVLRGYTSDEEGNTYITAQNTGMLYYGNLSFPSVVGTEPYSYIMKIDPQGNYLWHQTMNFSNTSMMRGQSIIVDSDQNIYLTMLYHGNAEIQGYELTPFIGISGYFTAKFNSLGEIIWLHPAGGRSLAFADENTLCVFEYNSPDGLIGSETITNYEGCVYKMDLDGNYQGHVQIDLAEYPFEVINGLNNAGEFYGYRVGPPEGTSAALEMFALAPDGSVSQSQIINYTYSYDAPSRLIHDASTGHYFMTGKFRNRIPFNSSSGVMESSLMLIHLDNNFNLLASLELGPALSANGGSPNFRMQAVDGNLYLCGVITITPYTFWTSLGQSVYLYPEQYKPIFAKLNGNLETMWHRAFPSYYYSADLFPHIHNGVVQLLAKLPEIEIDGFSTNPMGADDITIVNFNDSDLSVSSASGIIYVDANANGVLDEGELPASGIHVTNSELPGMHFYSDSNGHYQLPLIEGSQLITIDGIPLYWYNTTSASIEYIAELDAQDVAGLNFGIKALPDIQDLSVTISGVNFTNLAGEVNYTIDLCNYGTTITSGNLAMILDDAVTYISSSPEAIQSADTLFLPYANFQSGECMQFLIQGSLPADINLLNTDLESFVYTLSFENDSTPLNNQDSLQQIVIGPYDPNNITVDPECAISESFINTNQSLEYTIRFQNLGSDTANNITIRVPLSSFLDIEGFLFISTSHACSYEIINDELVILFNSILLPEAQVNESASQGYFRFSIKASGSIINASVIDASAAIFFDFNPPVITNTVSVEYLDPQFMIQRLITPASCPSSSDASLQIISFCPNASLSYSLDESSPVSFDSASINSLMPGAHYLAIYQYGVLLLEEDFIISTLNDVSLQLLQTNGSCPYASNGNFDIAISCVNMPFEMRIDDGSVFTTTETHIDGLTPGFHRLVVYTSTDSLVLENILIDTIPLQNFTIMNVPTIPCLQDSGSIFIGNECIENSSFSYYIDSGSVQTSTLGESLVVPIGYHQLYAFTNTDVLYDGEYLLLYSTYVDTSVMIVNNALVAGDASPGTTYQWYDCATLDAIDDATNPSFYPTTSGSYYFVAITTQGCEFQSTCHNLTISAVENLLSSTSIVYPNPANGPVLFEWENVGEVVTVYITNLEGQLIEEVSVKGVNRYSTYLPVSGVYFVTIQGTHLLAHHKIIVN